MWPSSRVVAWVAARGRGGQGGLAALRRLRASWRWHRGDAQPTGTACHAMPCWRRRARAHSAYCTAGTYRGGYAHELLHVRTFALSRCRAFGGKGCAAIGDRQLRHVGARREGERAGGLLPARGGGGGRPEGRRSCAWWRVSHVQLWSLGLGRTRARANADMGFGDGTSGRPYLDGTRTRSLVQPGVRWLLSRSCGMLLLGAAVVVRREWRRVHRVDFTGWRVCVSVCGGADARATRAVSLRALKWRSCAGQICTYSYGCIFM
mmetsp:Transcript_63170/g.168247  ORF Transcript_63170/g.168247 Transcript_63170/m.168247 type:complete len:263 (+) Transcript_63170:50-838(+)